MAMANYGALLQIFFFFFHDSVRDTRAKQAT